MIQELLTYFLPVAKFILAAALMVVFYNLLYKDKASFNRCRIFLLSIAFVSLLLSQFNIVVYTPPAKILEIEMEAPASVSVVAFTSLPALKQPMNALAVEKPTFMERLGSNLTLKNILISTYLLVTIGLLISLFIQLFQILAAKRKGSVKLEDGYEMVVSPGISTPFSFFKSIYIGENLSGAKRELILKHEQWHIKHQHYLDVLVMEILVRIFWFNPVLWWVRKELRNVSEFQADRSVLDEGHDLYQYQTLILEEVMEYNPYLANGFNNSFTKKRFIMMKNKCQTSFTTLRRALLIPFLAVVFAALSLSVGKSQVKYVTKTTTGNRTITKTVEVDSLNSGATVTTIDTSFSTDNSATSSSSDIKIEMAAGSQDKEGVDKALKDCSVGLGNAIIELRKLSKTSDVSVRKAGINKVFKGLDVKASSTSVGDYEFSDEFIKSFTSEDFLKSAANFSKIKKNVDILQKEPSTSNKLAGFQKQMMTLIQDEMMSKVLTEVMSGAMGTLMNTMGNMGNMSGAKGNIQNMAEAKDMVKGLLGAMTGTLGSMTGNQTVEPTEASSIDSKSSLSEDEFVKQAYMLKPEQVKEISMRFTPYYDIYTIEKSETETKVTLVLGISADDTWFMINRAAKIIDPVSKDEYHLRSVVKGIPLDKIIMAPSSKGKMIAITLIFPPLKESVKRMNLIVGILTNNENTDGFPIDFTGTNLDQYMIKETPKIYK